MFWTKPAVAAGGSLLILLLVVLAVPAFAETDSAQSQKSSTSPSNVLVEEANTAFWSRDYNRASELLTSLLANHAGAKEGKARLLLNLAMCQMQLDDLETARGNAESAIKLVDQNSVISAQALAIRAHWLLTESKFSQAAADYKQCIAIVEKLQGPWSVELAQFYEGLAACYLGDNKPVEASAAYKKVSQLDLLNSGPDGPHFAWSLLSLSNIEGRLGHSPVADMLFKKVFWNFRKQNEERILGEYKGVMPDDQLVQLLRPQLYGNTGAFENGKQGLDYIKTDIPADAYAKVAPRQHLFDHWVRERVGRERAPGLAFFNPTKKLRGLIITVHGLGLHGGSFTPFAREIVKEGFGVVSFDVRGFGSYRNDEVYQRVDLPAAITDLRRIIRELRADYADVPFILLGESMGGAIVLRIAALAPELVDAVISSVPSGSRFHDTSTSIAVALKLLKDKNEQFDIGSHIIAQATAKPHLRDMWEGDPSARLKISPAELINFNDFMNDNTKFAQQITKTPVIIFQGYSDNLVKPMGSLAIYQAIATKDKDMVFLGRAEHLIFEAGQTHPDVMKAVVAWIENHLPPAQATSPPAAK